MYANCFFSVVSLDLYDLCLGLSRQTAAMAEGSPSSKVKFIEDGSDKPHVVKHVPTQKYNRKEIQKRLDIESWMDEQLKELFDSDVRLCN